MKKIFLASIILFAMLSACKKENQSTAPSSENKQNLEQLILNFEQKLNSGQKDGTTYAIDSAVWYVEALLNYSFCEAGNQCHNIVVDTLWTIVNDPGTNGFTIEQLETVFDDLEDDIAENQPEDNIVFAIDLYAYPAGNLTVFEARTAYATLSEPAFKATADTSGYWYWGGDLGMCGPDTGLYVGTDASDILQNQFNSGASDIWTSLETNGAWPTQYYDPNFPFSTDVLEPTRLFSASDTAVPGVLYYCIWPALMEYYNSSSGIKYIIGDLTPTGKKFAYCDIEAGIPIGGWAIHTGSFTYGIA